MRTCYYTDIDGKLKIYEAVSVDHVEAIREAHQELGDSITVLCTKAEK